jgi:rhomboid family GlyGly-CTERM serine protease
MFYLLPRWLSCGPKQRNGLLFFAVTGVLIAFAAFTDDWGRGHLGIVPGAVQDGELWRVITGHLVHLSRMHAFMNELGLLFLIVVLWDVLEPWGLLIATLLAAISITLGVLLFHSNLPYYVGFSGITHGLFAWGGLRVWQSGQKGYAALILFTVVAKLIWEGTMGPTPGASEAVGGTILVESHLYGVIGAVIAAFFRPGRAHIVALLVLVAALMVPAKDASAHSIDDSRARILFNADGDLMLLLDIETAAFILREPPGALSDEARDRVLGMLDDDLQDYINGAGDYLLNTVEFFDDAGTVIEARRIRMPTPAALRRHAEAQDDGGAEQQALWLEFDGPSVLALEQPRLRLPGMVGPVIVIVARPNGTESVDLMPPGLPSRPLSLEVPGSIWNGIFKSILDGYRHVIPSGWDHALFMAILVIATPAVLTSLLHATIFTVAHSITLFLAGFGVVAIPSGPVELGIALTIALAGIDAAWRLRHGETTGTSDVSGPTRWGIIFAFGLLHGLGFASVFSDLQVSQLSLLTSLFGFNIGVELGQIVVILAVLTFLMVLRRLGSDLIAGRSRFVMSLIVTLIGCIWVGERALSLVS